MYLFIAQYQTVQVAAQPGMMTLQDGSQVVQTSVANVQMPLFTQQAGEINQSYILYRSVYIYLIENKIQFLLLKCYSI